MKKYLHKIALYTLLIFTLCSPNTSTANFEKPQKKTLSNEARIFRATVEQIINNITDEQVQGQLNQLIVALNDIEIEIAQPGADLNEISQSLSQIAQEFEAITLQSAEVKLLIASSTEESATQ